MAARNGKITQVASSASAVQLVAPSDLRRGDASGPSAVIANASTAILYILQADNSQVVSATNYTYQVAAGASVELWGYRGAVQGIWAAANGQAVITELQ